MDMEKWLQSFEVPTEVYQEQAAAYGLRTADVGESVPVVVDANPIEAVFMLQSAGVNEFDFKAQKKMIPSLLDSLTKKYGQKVKFGVILFDLDGASTLTTDTGSVWFTDAESLAKKLSVIAYENTGKYVEQEAAYRQLQLKVVFSGNAASFVYLIRNGSAKGGDELEIIKQWVRQGIHYSEITGLMSYGTDSEYNRVITQTIESSGGLEIKYSGLTQQRLLDHMSLYAEEKQTNEFQIIIPTGWQKITLNGPIALNSGTNSDSDGLSDYSEVMTEKLQWDATGNVILPTISEAVRGYSYIGLERFKSELWASSGMPGTEFEKYFDYVLNHTHILPIRSNPVDPDSDCDGLDDDVEFGLGSNVFTIDTDGDWVDDEEEVFQGLDPLESDTDEDGLSDGRELELGYDPSNANWDGDEYNDYEEYKRGSDPYLYECEIKYVDPAARIWYGAVYGDFVEDEEVDGYILLGQIGSGMVPFVSDVRDVMANVQKGDWIMALISGIGLWPGDGDSIKVMGELGQAVVKLGDDTNTMVKLFTHVADTNPLLAKLFGRNEVVAEGIEEAISAPAITRENMDCLIKYADEAEIVFEETVKRINFSERVLNTGQDVWKKAPCKRGQIIDEYINKHGKGKGLGRSFPVADRVDKVDGIDTLISTKSIDLNAKSYRDPKALEKRIQSYLDQLEGFEKKYSKVYDKDGFTWGGENLKYERYNGNKLLEIAIPNIPLTSEQEDVLASFGKKILVIRVEG